MPCKLYFLKCKTSLTYMQKVLTTFNTHSHTYHFIDIYYKKLSFHTNFKLFRLKVLFYVLNIVYIREHIRPVIFSPLSFLFSVGVFKTEQQFANRCVNQKKVLILICIWDFQKGVCWVEWGGGHETVCNCRLVKNKRGKNNPVYSTTFYTITKW